MKRIGPEDVLTVWQKGHNSGPGDPHDVAPEVTFPLLVHSFVPEFSCHARRRQSNGDVGRSIRLHVDRCNLDGRIQFRRKIPVSLFYCKQRPFVDWPGERVFPGWPSIFKPFPLTLNENFLEKLFSQSSTFVFPLLEPTGASRYISVIVFIFRATSSLSQLTMGLIQVYLHPKN